MRRVKSQSCARARLFWWSCFDNAKAKQREDGIVGLKKGGGEASTNAAIIQKLVEIGNSVLSKSAAVGGLLQNN